MVGDLEPIGDLPLEGAWLATIRRGRVGHQLQDKHLLLLATEQYQAADFRYDFKIAALAAFMLAINSAPQGLRSG